MQLVKGTADSIKKEQYLKQKEKLALKEKQIEEAKKLVDQELERRRAELAAKASVSKLGEIKEIEKEQIAIKKKQLKEQEEAISLRIQSMRELKLQENMQKAGEAQVKRELTKMKVK